MKRVLFWILAFTWELPQTVLALLVMPYVLMRGRGAAIYTDRTNSVHTFHDLPYSFSLGEFIFIARGLNERVKLHECGHTVQSRILGPLYLLVVGLPSVVQYWLCQWRVLSWTDYYDRFPENWADKLGGVE